MKNINKKAISIGAIILIICIIFFCIFFKLSFKTESLATNASELEANVYQKANIEELDIKKIIQNNTSLPIREELAEEEIELEYTTIYKKSDSVPKGKMQVIQEGREGVQKVVTKKKYQGDTLIGEEQTARTIKVSSVDKIVEIGTGESMGHKIQKGDKMYVTSYTLNVFLDKNKDSEKITTLNKGNEVKIIEIQDEWYRISYGSYSGWVDSNCLEYREIEPKNTTTNNMIVLNSNKGKTKEELISNLSSNMKLNSPSGLTLEQFKKVLSNNEQDKNKIFAENAEYFYYIEKQYNINGIFVAAVGIHESSWGTSKISMDKKNLFGYGANDSNPYDNAYSFSSYSEGIDLLARVFVKYYLNPKGTKIYDNEIATGRYYNGQTISDVNKMYATDKNWNKAVYDWMSYLYNRL